MMAENTIAIVVIYVTKDGIGTMHMSNMFAKMVTAIATAPFGKNTHNDNKNHNHPHSEQVLKKWTIEKRSLLM